MVFGIFAATWQRVLITAGSMIVVSYVFWGVAPRTLGQQHHDRIACALAGPLVLLTTVLGPFPRLLILVGNALTPGKGFEEGPFATEAELRELVDLAEKSEVIQSGERQMIHSVFDLGDTIVREVMVPRTDMVFIEEYKTLRQAVSLALRSGFSRIPVIRDGLDDVVGVLYLKDVIKRVYDSPDAQTSERVGSMMRKPVWCPDSKPIDELLREMQLKRVHLVIVDRRIRRHGRDGEHRGHPRGDRRRDHRRVRRGEHRRDPARRAPLPGVVPAAAGRTRRAVRSASWRTRTWRPSAG